MNDQGWGLAIQIFRDGRWMPLRDRQFPKKINALIAARGHVRRANREHLDPRNLAIFSFARGQFDEVPWA